MPHIILDTETTGTDPRRDKIVEVGAVRLDTGRTYHAYANPGIPCPPDATAIHGLTDAFLRTQPPFDTAALLAFIGDATIIAHNAPFDMAFIEAAAGKLPNPVIDTLALAKHKYPLANNTLDGLCRRFGISLADRTTHGALVDAQLLASVYQELIGRQAVMDLAAPEQNITSVDVPVRKRALEPRITQAELEAHARLLADIPGHSW